MNTITVIHISDIHYDKNEPENQGLILNAFFDDLSKKIDKHNKENTFCIISGDLVNKGNNEDVFERFYQNVILQLTNVVPIKNIFCSPGNHDLNRKIVEDNFDNHCDLVDRAFSESEFNDYIKSGGNIILEKFSFYEKFCKEKLHLPNFNMVGYSQSLIPEISVYFLNCSLFCYGGLKQISDKGKLKIETSGLNQWIHESKGRTKMLVMHHPIDYLTNFAQSEIRSMLIQDIDILISGHIHEQQLDYNYATENHGVIKLSSPQLFSDKTDLNGYSILTFNKGKISNIEYRQWVKRQRKFMAGQDFSGTENGIKVFNNLVKTHDDLVVMKLWDSYNKDMKSYSMTPTWVERTLCKTPPNSRHYETADKLDYINIINTKENYQIISAPQFGLTCYARYLALKAFEVNNEFWLYLNSRNWNFSRYRSDLDDALKDFNQESNMVGCILLDDWRNSLKDSHRILEDIKKKFPQSRVIIFTNIVDNIILEGLDSEESHEGFIQLYLRELTRVGLRNIVKGFNAENQISDENKVLERLDIDLVDLNIHRTPLNCLQLLIAFLNNFEDRPINRSKVFSYVLRVIFDNPGKLYYGDTLDEDNCGFVLGYFCEYLLRNSKESFTESEFHKECSFFCLENYNNTNTYDLLEVLKNNQIIVHYNGQLNFRFAYWVYYFAALRMKLSVEFSEYMLKDKHSLYYPEIIEFYTGIDGAREDVIIMLIEDLNTLTQKVHVQVGVKEKFNPYKGIKWALNETEKGLTQKQIIENVQQSKIPDELKDIVADENYDSIKPYYQNIYSFFERYEVKNLLDLIKSASKALRNSEFISPNLKEQLTEQIFLGWQEIIRVIFLIAPLLAKNGFGGYGGARFRLTGDYPEDYEVCLKSIITMLPYNLKLWFKDDIFSDKLILLFRKYMLEYPDQNIQHILALLECTARPKDWKFSILKYIESTHKNSFYLGDLYHNLTYSYTHSHMSQSEQRDTEYLIKACWAKHTTGSPKPGIETVSKVSNAILPQRNVRDIEE